MAIFEGLVTGNGATEKFEKIQEYSGRVEEPFPTIFCICKKLIGHVDVNSPTAPYIFQSKLTDFDIFRFLRLRHGTTL